MSSHDPNTSELVRLASSGDESAVQQLLADHRGRLRRAVAVRMDDCLKARFDPSDVVQEAMLRVTRRLPAYLEERPLPLYPWLRSIVLERFVDLRRRHLRSQGRSVAREAEWDLGRESVAELSQLLIGNETSPSGHVVRSETRQRVRQALERLSHDDRDLLLMRYLEQLRVKEIAAVLGISESATKSRLRRGLERLHDTLDIEDTEGQP